MKRSCVVESAGHFFFFLFDPTNFVIWEFNTLFYCEQGPLEPCFALLVKRRERTMQAGGCLFFYIDLLCLALPCVALPCFAWDEWWWQTHRQRRRARAFRLTIPVRIFHSQLPGGRPNLQDSVANMQKGWLRRKRGGDWRKESSWKWNMKIKSQIWLWFWFVVGYERVSEWVITHKPKKEGLFVGQVTRDPYSGNPCWEKRATGSIPLDPRVVREKPSTMLNTPRLVGSNEKPFGCSLRLLRLLRLQRLLCLLCVCICSA